MTAVACPIPETARPICDGTYNTDVVTITNKLNRFIAEAYMSESASVHTILPADLARFQAFNAELVRTQGWIMAQPQVDNPSVYPRFSKIAVWDSVPQIESDNIRTMIRGLETTRDELIMCQSSRISSGFLVKDNDRLTANLTRNKELLDMASAGENPYGTDYTATTPLVPVLSRNMGVLKA